MGAIVQTYWDDHLTYSHSLRSIFVEQSIALVLLFLSWLLSTMPISIRIYSCKIGNFQSNWIWFVLTIFKPNSKLQLQKRSIHSIYWSNIHSLHTIRNLPSIHKKMPWNNSKTRSMRMYLLNSMIKQEKNLKYWG